MTKDNLTTEEGNKLLLFADNEGRTVFHLAAEFCILQVFRGIFILAKENVTTEEGNKLILATVY